MRLLFTLLVTAPIAATATDMQKVSYSGFNIPLPKWEKVLKANPIIESKEGFSSISLESINKINNQCNKVEYKTDRSNYNQVDYWASPEEFLKNGGDCEDYAICKYYKLREKGFSVNDLAIVMGYNRELHDFHAVLSVKFNGNDYILDNNIKAIISQDFYYKNILIPYYRANEFNVSFN